MCILEGLTQQCFLGVSEECIYYIKQKQSNKHKETVKYVLDYIFYGIIFIINNNINQNSCLK